mgnify:CR=1 FL=1
MPIDPDTQVQISKIVDTGPVQSDGHGYLGFIITYPDGRIENKVLEYDRESFEKVHARIEKIYLNTRKHYQL